MQKATGNSLSWSVLVALAGAVAVAPAGPGCAPIEHKEASEDWAVDSVVVGDVLAAVGPEVVEPGLARFIAATDELDRAFVDWQSALDSGSSTAAARTDVREAWTEAMLIWQELELLQIGPAGSSLSAIGGEDLRDEIYSWPTVNPCRVDQELVFAAWTQADWFEANLVNSYGMDALEHVVHGGLDNTCPSQVDINAEGGWAALSELELEQRRVDFGRTLTAHVADLAEELADTWSAEGGNLSGALAAAGAGSIYSSEQEALNAVFDALFYLDTRTKDRKLGQPLGLVECSTGTCPEAAEHLISELSPEAVVANLVGFRSLFTGGQGAGMDDLLVELGHEDIASDMLTAVDAAIAAAEAVELPIHEAVVTQPEQVEAMHLAVRGVTDILKGDLVTVLSLSIPSEAAGDND